MAGHTAHTLLELLSRQAERHRDKVAFRFCPDGEAEEARLSYAELDTRARAIAADLQQRGAAGQRVLLFCHPGLDAVAGFFGCFYAGAIAVPVDEHWASQRAAAVIPDARAEFALATTSSLTKLPARVADLVGGQQLRWLAVDDPQADPESWALPRVGADSVAVIQYTSGSTDTPKGVVLTHGNYLHNLEMTVRAWYGGSSGARIDPDDNSVTGVSWLPQYHDMGFVGGVLAPLYVGGSAVHISQVAFLMRPMRWLEAMSRHRAMISAGPNLGYHLCVQRSTPEQRAALDLSHWAVAVNGGDPVNAATLREFAEAFAPAGFRPDAFRPAYGLAEATLGVTGIADSPEPMVLYADRDAAAEDRVVPADPESETAAAVVGCGRPQDDQQVLIVDPDTRRRRGPDEIGEIWVAGPSVAQGYWRRPEQTQRTFGARLADTGEGPFLRTGDLGFLRDGELFVAGRSQDLITIAGSHHYPNDIEATVQACAPVLLADRGAAFAVAPSAGVEQLIVVQEVHRHHTADLTGVIEAIRAAVATHHRLEPHAVLLVKPMRIPTTSSGKIRRGACREQFEKRELEPVAQWPAAGEPAGFDAKQLKSGLARMIGGALVRSYLDPRRP